MQYLDYLFAWTILVTAVVFMLLMEIHHLRGAVLDIPFLWMVIAMLNFLRLRNPYANVVGLRISCIGANVIGLMLEAMRWKVWGGSLLRNWGLYTLIIGVSLFVETIFSVARKNGSTSPAAV